MRGRFELLQRRPLGPYLPGGYQFTPTLCVSDTHLTPKQSVWDDSAPDRLLSLLKAFPAHQVYVLGDFIESLTLTTQECANLSQSIRLRPLFRELRRRPGLRIIPGNHDVHVLDQLRKCFGGDKVYAGGWTMHKLRFVHGHESAMFLTEAGRHFGQYAVPCYVLLQRFSIPVPNLEANQAIARAMRGMNFLVFGHTHKPELRPTYANCGSYLRQGERTFILLGNREISLWRSLE